MCIIHLSGAEKTLTKAGAGREHFHTRKHEQSMVGNAPSVVLRAPESQPSAQRRGITEEVDTEPGACDSRLVLATSLSNSLLPTSLHSCSIPASIEPRSASSTANPSSSGPTGCSTASVPPQVLLPISGSDTSGRFASTEAAATTITTRDTPGGGTGICYDIIDSQSRCKDGETVRTDFALLKSRGHTLVRVYDVGCPQSSVAQAAHQTGLRLMVGMNELADIQSDLEKLTSMVGSDWSVVSAVYVGNELVNQGRATGREVADRVSQARSALLTAGFEGSVVTVDTFNQMAADPTICSTSDFCAINAHAFFDPTTAARDAGTFVSNAYHQVAAANPGKRIVVTESGWPWQGTANGEADPSPDNQRTALNSIKEMFPGPPGDLFEFQALDARYKQPGPFGVEPFFGIYGERE